MLTQALQELKSPAEFAEMLDRSGCAALRLIEAPGRLYRNQFERKVQRYQDTASNAEADKLWSEIWLELFGA